MKIFSSSIILFSQVIEYRNKEIERYQLPRNDKESLETYNIFEYLQDEETFEEREETDFSNEKDNFNQGKLINSDNKNQKKKKNERQRKIKKRRDQKVQEKSLIKRNETMSNTLLKRCLGCNFDHFPLPKFCRWWEERKSVKKGPWRETRQLSIEENIIVEKSIQYLEEKFGQRSKTPKEESALYDVRLWQRSALKMVAILCLTSLC